MSEPSEQRHGKPKRTLGCWWAAAIGLVLLGVVCYPAVNAMREAANRAHCCHHFCQIGLAMHCYHEVYGSFPPAYTTDSNGNRLHSWRVLLLPHIGDAKGYKDIRLDEPWDSPHNREAIRKTAPAKDPIYWYHCCEAPNPESETSYVMVVGANTISDGPHGVRIADIKDGTSNTIMFVEIKNSGIHWAEPRDLDFATMSFRINDPNGKGVSGHHPGMAGVGLANGGLRFLDNDTDPKVLKALLTINGGEDVRAFMNR
jgi:hypothetical protein